MAYEAAYLDWIDELALVSGESFYHLCTLPWSTSGCTYTGLVLNKSTSTPVTTLSVIASFSGDNIAMELTQEQLRELAGNTYEYRIYQEDGTGYKFIFIKGDMQVDL